MVAQDGIGASGTRRVRVLIVEDDPGVADVLLLACDQAGYEAQAVTTGKQALQVLSSWRPDVILLDLAMPELDGWSFRAQQLTRRSIAAIPVIVLTAGQNLDERLAELQAAAILPKPFELDVLFGAIERLAAKQRGAHPLRHVLTV